MTSLAANVRITAKTIISEAKQVLFPIPTQVYGSIVDFLNKPVLEQGRK